LNKRIEKSGHAILIIIINSTKKVTVIIFLLISLAISLNFISIPKSASTVVTKIIIIMVILLIIIFINGLIRNIVSKYPYSVHKIPPGMATIAQILVWIVGLLSILVSLGYNITTFVAGLGIGGVAIALASQSILSDLFNYFVILFDKPFEKDDFIQINNQMGTVEDIGIKTTRIRSISGESISVPNTNLTQDYIQNFAHMFKRRFYAKLGVEYSTPYDKLKQVPDMLQNIVESTEDTEFVRAYFCEFGDSSLNFEFVYFVLSGDYLVYAKTVEKINYRIVEEFEKLGLAFAFPTRTINIVK